MARTCVTVFGGSGYLGSRIVARLAADGCTVRVAVRHPERIAGAASASDGGVIVPVGADIRDATSVADAARGSDAVVNAVGLYVERGPETFEAVHVEGAAHVAREAARAGTCRLVHISGIGADPGSESPYVRARARGEEAVRSANPAAVLLRPSALFGPGDSFLTLFHQLVDRSPVIPLFGAGKSLVQPVYVGDVSDAVAAALEDPSSQGQIYELGGPRAYQYRSLIELVMKRSGRRRLLLPVPFFVWRALARLVSVLPRPPLTLDQIVLVERDNIVGARMLSLADLGINPTELEDVLPKILG